jgi:hypothetical protein
MHKQLLVTLFIAASTIGLAGISQAQTTPPAAAPPPFATTKVEGTDNVYVFRYQNHQSMFVVTPAGVIATDPISYGRPQAAVTYVAEIKKITDKPIKYLIYSHHHYDHIAGGKPFKDAGAVIIAHKRAKERLATLKAPDVVLPDQVVTGKRTIKLGGTTLELVDVGRNHSDSSLVMLLPKAGLGPSDPRTSGAWWAPRNPAGHGAAVGLHDRAVKRDQKGIRRRQMFRSGHQGSARAKVCDAAGLRTEYRVEHPSLVRLLGPRHLTIGVHRNI